MKRIRRSYQEFWAEILVRYRQAVVDEQELAREYQREARFIFDLLELSPGQRVLDLGCGLGEHCLALAGLGMETVGIDIAPFLVARAEERAGLQNANARFACADMRQYRPDEPFDAVIMSSGTFGLFSADSDNAAVARTIQASLRKNARFLVGPSNSDLLTLPDFHQQEWHLMEDGCFLRETAWDKSTAQFRERMLFVDEHGIVNEFAGFDNDSEGQVSAVYDLTQLRDMMEKAGLEVTGLYGSFDLPPVPYILGKSPRLLIAGRRP